MTSRNICIKDKEYSALMRRLDGAKLRFKSQPVKITGIYLELAEYLKNSIFLMDKAEQNYEKVVSWGQNSAECSFDCSLAYRSLAEIAVEKGDFDSAINKIVSSLDFAYKTENPGLIQQALHQRAHINMSCGFPEKALSYAEECVKYLEINADEINKLKKDGDSNCRMAHLHNFMAAIYSELHFSNSLQQYNYDRMALKLNEKAINYASEHEDWSLLYRSLLMKLELTIGKERVSIAQMMCNIAAKIIPTKVDENKFKKESKCHLSLEKLRHCEQGNFAESKAMLWKRYEELKKEPDSVSQDLYEAVKNALVFIYKTDHRLKKANSMNVKNNAMRRCAQMAIFEKIGDEASFLGLNEIALTFYQRMLKSADKADDKRTAWCSMAESAKDCRLWSRALAFYKEVKALEEQLAYGDKEIIDTDIAIAIVSAEVEQIPLEERLDTYREVYKNCRTAEQKLNILSDYKEMLKGGGHAPVECTEADEFDALSEQQILFNIANEMKVVERNEKMVKERSNKNNYGESNLHEVARSGEYQQLKQLIDRGYDVNQMDHGGWTPLSEAVSTQNLANTSSGLTPLMEACSVGNVEIGKMLLQFKARASSKDDDDWSALEYLNEFVLNSKTMDQSQEEKLRRFGELLKHRQTEEGFAFRSYEHFLELFEQKRASSQRNSHRKSGSSQRSFISEPNDQRRRKRRLSGTLSDPESDNDQRYALEKENKNAWIDEDDETEGTGKIVSRVWGIVTRRASRRCRRRRCCLSAMNWRQQRADFPRSDCFSNDFLYVLPVVNGSSSSGAWPQHLWQAPSPLHRPLQRNQGRNHSDVFENARGAMRVCSPLINAAIRAHGHSTDGVGITLPKPASVL
uniref:ANK_REP_REGION domain-containing protein n=1 Tax=Globodera rostochiensis TaxID=31243 RepID=A0A914GT84_GLORO